MTGSSPSISYGRGFYSIVANLNSPSTPFFSSEVAKLRIALEATADLPAIFNILCALAPAAGPKFLTIYGINLPGKPARPIAGLTS